MCFHTKEKEKEQISLYWSYFFIADGIFSVVGGGTYDYAFWVYVAQTSLCRP